MALERTVINENCSRSVRIVAGFALFCAGGRLRHGDATRIMNEPVIEPEAVMKHGRGHGFIEAEGGVTKTKQTRARKKWKVPMVSHSWGLSTEEWGPTWLKLRAKAKLNAAIDGMLMLGCGPDWSLVPRTRMTSDTMTILLREIVAMSEPDLDMSKITSHQDSKPGDDMVRLYGRDFLAEPMRQLAHVLLWVADGVFDPDETRSGRWVKHPATKVTTTSPNESGAAVLALNQPPCVADEPPPGPREAPALVEKGMPELGEGKEFDLNEENSDTSDDEDVPKAVAEKTEEGNRAAAALAVATRVSRRVERERSR